MSVEDDGFWEGFVSSIVSDEHSHTDNLLSPEDAAWVDSCLVKDTKLSDNTWDTMKGVLLDIITPETPPDHSSSVAEDDPSMEGTSTDILMSEVPGPVDENYFTVSDKDNSGFAQGFLLSDKLKYRERNKGKKVEDEPEVSPADETELSHDDIFKVWDLNTPLEDEVELVKQLEKAIEESLPTTKPLDNDDSIGLDLGALDSIISGLADLSLHPLPGY
ncbi:hypothetical protein ACHQM5_015638 [Ranunculus cassubicifolius]